MLHLSSQAVNRLCAPMSVVLNCLMGAWVCVSLALAWPLNEDDEKNTPFPIEDLAFNFSCDSELVLPVIPTTTTVPVLKFLKGTPQQRAANRVEGDILHPAMKLYQLNRPVLLI